MIRTNALLTLLVLTAVSQAETKHLKANANRLVAIKPPKPAAFIVNEPIGLDTKQFELKDGSTVLVFFTGANKRIVLTAFCNGETFPEVTQYVITVGNPGPSPGPNPPGPQPPTPNLKGLALDVWKKAKEIGMSKADATILGTNYETVASAIAAGGIRSVGDAMNKLSELNRKKWPRSAEPLIAFVRTRTPRTINLTSLKETLEAIGAGLLAI